MADKADKHRKLTGEEKEIALEGPAISANRSLIALTPGGVRITFVEQVDDSIPRFRVAVMLPIQDAISLKDVLGRLLANVEGQIKEIAATKDAAEEGVVEDGG